MTKTNDPWVKVLEGRVAEWELKHNIHKEGIKESIEDFRAWVRDADDLDIYSNAEYRAEKIKDSRETYLAVFREYKKAEAELETYKEVMGYEQ